MLIGEAAQKAGVSRDTVRLYTRLGLIRATTRSAGTRTYADYDDDAVELIVNIKIAKSIGFTLAELRPIADQYSAGWLDAGKQRALLENKLAEIQAQQEVLNVKAAHLRSKLHALAESTSDRV